MFNEIVFLVVGALFGFSFGLVALQIKEAAAHAPLVSDALGMGLWRRGSNFFPWGLLFACTILPFKCPTNGSRPRLGFVVPRPLAHSQLVSSTLGLAVCCRGSNFFASRHRFVCTIVILPNTSDETFHKVDITFQ